MATFAAELYTHVTSISGIGAVLGSPVRFYPQNAPDGVAFPFTVYQRINENGNPHLTGQTDLAEATYQFSTFALTQVSVYTVADFLRINIDGQNINSDFGTRNVRSSFLISEVDTYEDYTDGSQRPLYRIDQDYSFIYTRSLT